MNALLQTAAAAALLLGVNYYAFHHYLRFDWTRDQQFTLPANVVYVSASGSGWSASQSGGVVTFTGGTLNAGGSAALTVTVTPTAAGKVASHAGDAVINPDGLKNQIMGANIMGLGGALFEAIEFENGRVLNNRFSKYRVPRFRDVPAIEVVLLDRKDIPSAGAGETPIVGLAPAVGNAIFNATGTRLRSLPMVPNGLKA